MVSQEEKHIILSRVLNSNTFKKSTTLNVLLKFLGESSINEYDITVFAIGEELFGKKYNPEKSDVNIRVNISHLRKKLALYYKTEGKNDSIIINIEPGQYATSFLRKEKEAIKSTKWKIVSLLTILLTLILLFILQLTQKKDKVWEQMFSNKMETTLYLGDVFGFSGTNAFGNKSWQRDPNINSIEEFHTITKQNTEKYKDLAPEDFTYVVFENSYNIKPFTQYFTQNDYDFTIRPGSDFKTRSLQGKNSIYAGPIHVHKKFHDLFNKFSKNVKIEGTQKSGYLYKNSNDNISININTRSKEGEYAIASAFNGADNTRHYFFFSNHGMGLTAVVEYFTKKESLIKFTEKHIGDSDEFTCLFFVKGTERTSLSLELIHIDHNN